MVSPSRRPHWFLDLSKPSNVLGGWTGLDDTHDHHGMHLYSERPKSRQGRLRKWPPRCARKSRKHSMAIWDSWLPETKGNNINLKTSTYEVYHQLPDHSASLGVSSMESFGLRPTGNLPRRQAADPGGRLSNRPAYPTNDHAKPGG